MMGVLGKEAVPELVLEESIGVEQKERREVGWRKWRNPWRSVL